MAQFSEEFSEILLNADIEAARRNQKEKDIQHVLIAALEVEKSEIKDLINIVSSAHAVRDELESYWPDYGNDSIEKTIRLPESNELNRILVITALEFRSLPKKIQFIGGGHFLLALLKDGKGDCVEILHKHGINYEKIRDAMTNESPKNESAPGKPKSQNKNKKEKTVLDHYGRNLNQLVKENKIDPIIGRLKEIQRVIEILGRKRKNNPILIGDPGVGKTAIAEGIAYNIVHRNVNPNMMNKIIYNMDLTLMVAGAKYRGQFEERIQAVLDEAKEDPNIILFIDELHTLVGAGNAEGAMDAANILKPALARGEIQCIGATTLNEFRKNIEKDGALARRFQSVFVDESSYNETLEIVNKLKPSYELFHKVKYTPEAIKASVDLSIRYISDRFLPDKAIDLIDESGSKVKNRLSIVPAIIQIYKRIDELNVEKNKAVTDEDFEKATNLKNEVENLTKSIDDIEKENESKVIQSITKKDIEETVSNITGIPASRLSEDQYVKLSELPNRLAKNVIGQEEAISTITKSLKKNALGLKDSKRPIGVFCLLGPSGSGKTFLAKNLAKELFDDEDACIRFDMSEYMEKFNVSKLIGAPPGYVGYEEGGQLTEKVRRKPYSIVLFDEIEKAHPDIFNILLQILGEGRLTDSDGRLINFKNTVIIMTSNVGTSFEKKSLGFVENTKDEIEKFKSSILGEFNKIFSKEMRGRLDGVIVFNPLNKNDLFKIIDNYVDEFKLRLKDYNIDFELDEKTKNFLVSEGSNESFGARELRRKIETHIEDLIADSIINGSIHSGEKIKFTINENKIIIDK